MKITLPKIKLNFTSVVVIGLVIFFVLLVINRLITNVSNVINTPSNTQGVPRDFLGPDDQEDSADQSGDTFDPTNPATYTSSSASSTISAEPITSVTLLQYISGTNPSTDNYSLYIDGNQAIVVLKNGYTQERFEKEFLSRFTNVGNAQIVYVDEAAYRDQVP